MNESLKGTRDEPQTLAGTFRYKVPFYFAGVFVGIALVRVAFAFISPVVMALNP